MSYAQPFDVVRNLMLDLYAADDPDAALVSAFEPTVFFGTPVTDLAAWFPADGKSFAAPGDVASEDERLGLVGVLGEANMPSEGHPHDKSSRAVRWGDSAARLGFGFVDASGFSLVVLAACSDDADRAALLLAAGTSGGPLEHLVTARLRGPDSGTLEEGVADGVRSIVRYYCGVAFERLPPAA